MNAITELLNPPTNTSSAFAGMKVIDVDTHWSEPEDLWTKRAPASLRDRVPQVRLLNGQPSWVINGNLPMGLGASASSIVGKDGKLSRGLEFMSWRGDDVHPSSFDPTARLAMMDKCGIHAEIVYPNVMGFGGQNTAQVDPALRLASAQIYNDASIEMQETSGGRILPMAMVPWWDIEAAVTETRRAHAGGLKGININSDPHTHKDADGNPLPDLSQPYWYPLWALCEELDVPINFHIGASEQSMDWLGTQGWPSLTSDSKAALSGSMLFINNGRVMGNLIYSGLLDRFRKLQFVSVESGVGWVPFLLESLDYQYEHINHDGNLERRPSEYFRTNFHATFWFEQRDISHTIDLVGVDNVMFETDFPHIVCLYPDPLGFMDKGLAKLDHTARAKVMGGNAARIYHID